MLGDGVHNRLGIVVERDEVQPDLRQEYGHVFTWSAGNSRGPIGEPTVLLSETPDIGHGQPTLDQRARYDRMVLLVGARSPDDLIFTRELETWRRRGADVRMTVDRGQPGWEGHIGLVTSLIEHAVDDPADTAAFVCGPEIMMRLSADMLVRCGIPAADVRVSLERNMRCGAALCGHCQLGPLLLCRDGPVVSYAEAAPLLTIKEL